MQYHNGYTATGAPIPSEGEAAADCSVLVCVDTETSMVFAHVCKRKGADPDILETLMKDIEVLGHRQIEFQSGQESRRPEMKQGHAVKRVIGLIRVRWTASQSSRTCR